MLVRSLKHGRLVLLSLASILWLAQDTETMPRPEWANDSESTLIHHRHTIKIFSICHKGISYSFPTNKLSPEFPTISEWAALFKWYFEEINPNVVSVFHNANYDIRVMRQCGWPFFKRVWDTMISGWLANANEDKSLKSRAPFYGRHIRDTKTVDFNDLAGISSYAEEDVVVTDEIYQQHKYGKIVRPQQLRWMTDLNVWSLPVANPVGEFEISPPSEQLDPFARIFLEGQEFPVLRSTIEAEGHGVPLNVARLHEKRVLLEADETRLLKSIYRMAGKKFSLTANKQKLDVLQSLGVVITKQTKKGALSVNFESMLEVSGQHPIVREMMEYSKVDKMKGTYLGVNGFEYYLNKKTGCIHPNLNTVGAVTGRFSASAPNLQTVPARNDRYGVKGCFEAPKGEMFICMDFSQIELRVMALMSKDPLMTKVLNDPKGDIHTETSTQLKIPRDPAAKQCNFLLIFGGGARALQQRLKLESHDVEEDECQDWINKFDNTYVNVRAFREHQFEFHRKNGFVYLLTGRRREIENIGSNNRYLRHKAETQLANNLIQGSAQDLLKAVIVRCSPNRPNMDRSMPKLLEMSRTHQLLLKDYAAKIEKYRREFVLGKLKWRLQVHDEVLYTADKYAAVDLGHRISEIMTWTPYWEPITPMSVRVRGDGGVGQTWAEAKKPKDEKFKIHSPV